MDALGDGEMHTLALRLLGRRAKLRGMFTHGFLFTLHMVVFLSIISKPFGVWTKKESGNGKHRIIPDAACRQRQAFAIPAPADIRAKALNYKNSRTASDGRNGAAEELIIQQSV